MKLEILCMRYGIYALTIALNAGFENITVYFAVADTTTKMMIHVIFDEDYFILGEFRLQR